MSALGEPRDLRRALEAYRFSLEEFGRAERLARLDLFAVPHVATPRELAGLTRCPASQD